MMTTYRDEQSAESLRGAADRYRKQADVAEAEARRWSNVAKGLRISAKGCDRRASELDRRTMREAAE